MPDAGASSLFEPTSAVKTNDTMSGSVASVIPSYEIEPTGEANGRPLRRSSPRDRGELPALPPGFCLEHGQTPRADRALVECFPADVVGVVSRRTPAARACDPIREIRDFWIHAPSCSPKLAARALDV